MTTRHELKEFRYGNCVIRTWMTDEKDWHPYPWRFSVQRDGENEHRFCGVPNYCGSRASAIMRGVWRARWIIADEFNHRYVQVPLL